MPGPFLGKRRTECRKHFHVMTSSCLTVNSHVSQLRTFSATEFPNQDVTQVDNVQYHDAWPLRCHRISRISLPFRIVSSDHPDTCIIHLELKEIWIDSSLVAYNWLGIQICHARVSAGTQWWSNSALYIEGPELYKLTPWPITIETEYFEFYLR